MYACSLLGIEENFTLRLAVGNKETNWMVCASDPTMGFLNVND